MKKKYEKPAIEIIDLLIEETLADNGLIDGSTGEGDIYEDWE